MKKRVWPKVALGVAAMLQPSASNAALSQSWSPVIKGPLASGLIYCTTFRGYTNGSVLMLQINQKTMRHGFLIVKLLNTNWSITPATSLPELTFRDANGSGLVGVPEAIKNAMVFHLPIGALLEWSDTLKGESFVLMQGDEPLDRFDSAGLAQAVRSVQACGRAAFPS